MNNPVGKALTQVLALLPSSTPAQQPDAVGGLCVGYSFSCDGVSLWRDDGRLAAKTMIVLWDGLPQYDGSGDVNLGVHLNPLAWAICALRSHAARNIVVVDSSPKHNQKVGRLYRTLASFQPELLPWLRIVALQDFGRILVHLFQEGCPASDSQEPRRDEMIKILSAQIREELTRESGGNDRHAIQNIIGPMVLLGSDYLAKKGVAERALLRVFEATGLLPKNLTAGDHPSNTIKAESWGKLPLRLLLVDDQADCGWTDWVRANLPTANPDLVNFELDDVITSPDALLDRLMTEWTLMGNAKDRRFELRLATGSKQTSDRQPVLLLDLRLHSMRSVESEAKFIQKLLPLCDRFKSKGNQEAFAWPGFSAQELQDVRSWCEYSIREGFVHRLVSVCDPADIPASGFKEVVIARIETNNTLHFRVFTSVGQKVMDKSEAEFPNRTAEIAALKQQLANLWGQPSLTADQQVSVRTTLASIIRDTPREAPEHLLALSLLPRLIALMDMSLPIIIFSSTGQRALIEKFKPYGNIITDFEKPRFFGRDARNVIAETHAKLEAAISKAARLVEARELCRLCHFEGRQSRTPASISPSQAGAFADVFVDESGNPTDGWFSVGGMMLVYPNPNAKRQLCERMKLEGLVWGVDEDRFAPGQRFKLPSRGAYIPKHLAADSTTDATVGAPYEEYLVRIDKCLSDCGVSVSAVGLRTNKSPAGVKAILSAGLPLNRGDAAFQSLVRDLLEGCLFGVIPAFGVNLLPLNVHLAMRSTPVGASERNLLEALLGARGFTPPDDKGVVRYCSLGTDDVFPMVLDLIRGHPEHKGAFRPVRARAARLTDFDSLHEAQRKNPGDYQRMLAAERNTFPEQLHYLADWIARFARWTWNDVPPTAKRWFQRGFHCEQSDGFQQCLEAGRLLDRGIHSDTLTALHHARVHSAGDAASPFGLLPWFLHQAGKDCSCLKGVDLVRVWERL